MSMSPGLGSEAYPILLTVLSVVVYSMFIAAIYLILERNRKGY